MQQHYNKPYPWLTKGAVEALQQFITNNPEASVLEFGCGQSTKWFVRNGVYPYSIDHDAEWRHEVLRETKGQAVIVICDRPYHHEVDKFADDFFDIVIVDGLDRKDPHGNRYPERVECVRAAKRLVRSGGILMLDNSERPEYNEAFTIMSDWPVHHAKGPDMTGTFNYKDWTTTWWRRP